MSRRKITTLLLTAVLLSVFDAMFRQLRLTMSRYMSLRESQMKLFLLQVSTRAANLVRGRLILKMKSIRILQVRILRSVKNRGKLKNRL